MKYLSILILALFAWSCCATKQANETSKEQDIVQVNTTNEVDEDTETEGIVETENDDGVENNSETTIESETVSISEDEDEDEDETIENTSNTNESVETQDSFDHSSWNSLLQRHVTKDGNVDYKGFKRESTKLRGYIASLINNEPTENTSRSETFAFWINAYNALTIDLIIRNYPLESIKDIKEPWDQRLWKFGDKWLNLNDIEHQILRKMDEPRIHFAIVCASISCPKLQNKAFTADSLEEQLTNATKEFLTDNSKNQLSENSIKLSKIFKWFGKDFKTKNSSLIEFLNQYSSIEISSSAKKSYLDYNWDLNE